MIPTIPESALPDVSAFSEEQSPGKTYRLDLNNKRIAGIIDDLDAIAQAAYKILYTERYAWLIYDWTYGMQIEQYIGKSMPFVIADLQEAITEALQVDDRIVAVQDFKIEKTQLDALYVEFTVISNVGSTEINFTLPAQ